MIKTATGAGLLLLGSILSAGYLDEQLVAAWTFNGDNETSALTDISGRYPLKKTFPGGDRLFEVTKEGTVRLGGGALLSTGKLAEDPALRKQLAKGMTLWMRARFFEPKNMSGFVYQAFLNADAPADWKQISAGLYYVPVNGACFYGTTADGKKSEFGAGARCLRDQTQFNEIAFTFDGATGHQSLYLNGEFKTKRAWAPEGLADFRQFLLGRVRKAGGIRIEIDEVRLYKTALSDSDLRGLKPVKKGEKKQAETMMGTFLVEPFNDLGGWRGLQGPGTTRGRAFGTGLTLAGERHPDRPDGFAGRADFDFDGSYRKGGHLEYRRFRPFNAGAVKVHSVEFDVNTRNIPCRIGFRLQDARGKKVILPPRDVGASGEWRHISYPLNAETVKEYESIVFPCRLQGIFLEAPKGRNHIYLDDIALKGEFSSAMALRILPELDATAREPGKPFHLSYRLSHAGETARKGTLSLQLMNSDFQEVFRTTQSLVLPPNGRPVVTFKLPGQPIGSYHANLLWTGEDGSKEPYLDWIAVFRPNGKRINRTGMQFGVMGAGTGYGRGAGRLHSQWLRELGIDIMRETVTGDRIEQGDGIENYADMGRPIQTLQDAGVDICFSYMFGVPEYVRGKGTSTKYVGGNEEAFRTHIRRVLTFLSRYPAVKYFEWWNEADGKTFDDSMKHYVQTLHILREERDRIMPKLKILNSGVTTADREGRRENTLEMISGGRQDIDVACFHSHGLLDAYKTSQAFMCDVLNKVYGNPDFPVCNTESGERGGYTAESILAHAPQMIRKIVYAKTFNTRFFIFFILRDYWDLDPGADDSFGMFTADNRPKPMVPAYNELIRQLADTERGEEIRLHPSLTAYRFRKCFENQDVIALWPTVGGQRIPLVLEGSGSAVFTDMYGQSETVNAENGMLFRILPGQPSYLSFPRGAFRPGKSPVEFLELPAGVPKEKTVLKFRLNAPADEDAVFHLDAGSGKLRLPVSSGKSARAEIAALVPADGNNSDTAGIPLRVRMEKKSGDLAFDFPVAIRLCTPVPIEGKQKALPLKLNQKVHVADFRYDPHIPAWKGAQDLSVCVQVSRNATELLIAADVTDDRHCVSETPEFTWKDDSIQFGIGGSDGSHFEFTMAGSGKGPAMVWCHIAPEPKWIGEWKQFPASVTRRNGVTEYRIRIPLSVLRIQNHLNATFRMNFLVNENDGQGRVRFLEWADGIGRGKNVDGFNWMILK